MAELGSRVTARMAEDLPFDGADEALAAVARDDEARRNAAIEACRRRLASGETTSRQLDCVATAADTTAAIECVTQGGMRP